MPLSVNNHLNAMKAAILNPKAFFANVSDSERLGKPTVFVLINTVITFILSALFSLVTSSALLRGQNQLPNAFAGPIGLVIGLIFVVPLMLVLLFIITAILHVIAKILSGKGKFSNTYQALAYASAISPLTAIPILGFLASFYQLYMTVIGLKRFHQYSTAKAILNVLIPVVFVIVIAGIAVVLLGAAAIGLMKSTGLKPADLKNLQNLQNVQKPEDLQNLYPTFVPKNDADYPTGYDDYSNTAE